VALRRAQDDDYHLIITDLVMPNLDGLEMVRELRETGVLAEIIVMTAYSTLDRAVEAHGLGVSDYLLKPFENLAEVGEVVGAAATRHRRWRRAITRTIDRGG
jgi:YesN/AraC family two-component response regulator